MSIPFEKILGDQEEYTDFEQTFSEPLETKNMNENIVETILPDEDEDLEDPLFVEDEEADLIEPIEEE